MGSAQNTGMAVDLSPSRSTQDSNVPLALAVPSAASGERRDTANSSGSFTGKSAGICTPLVEGISITSELEAADTIRQAPAASGTEIPHDIDGVKLSVPVPVAWSDSNLLSVHSESISESTSLATRKSKLMTLLSRLPLQQLVYFCQMAPAALGETAPWTGSNTNIKLLFGIWGFSTTNDYHTLQSDGDTISSSGDSYELPDTSTGDTEPVTGVCVFPSMTALGKVFSTLLVPASIIASVLLWHICSPTRRRLSLVPVLSRVVVLVYWEVELTTFRLIHCVSFGNPCLQSDSGNCVLYEAAEDVECLHGWQISFVILALALVAAPAMLLTYVECVDPTKWATIVKHVMTANGWRPSLQCWSVPAGILFRLFVAAVGIFLRTVPVARAVLLTNIFVAYTVVECWTRVNKVVLVDRQHHWFNVSSLTMLTILSSLNIPTATIIQVRIAWIGFVYHAALSFRLT